MKFLLLTISVATMLFCSCSNDENDNELIMGTCWDKEESDSPYEYRSICFGVDRASFSSKMINDGPFHYDELKYTYKKPNIKITHEDGSRFGSGYIEGNTLYITDGLSSEGTYIKTKK